MAEKKQLHWQSLDDLMLLTNKVQKSVDSSMKNADMKEMKSCLMATSNYITDEVFELTQGLLKNANNRDPVIVISVDAQKVEISFVTIVGHRMSHVTVVDKWVLKEINHHVHSRDTFFAHIAQKCYEVGKTHSNSFSDIEGGYLYCAMIFRFRIEQTSINESTLSKFSKNFFIPDCEGQDLVQHFNKQLVLERGGSHFRLKCTHLTSYAAPAFLGACTHTFDEDRRPDVYVSASHGNSIFYFEKGHGMKEFQGERVMMDFHFSRFGESISSLENNFLKRFLVADDITINGLNANTKNLMRYFINGSEMCDVVQIYLKSKLLNFSTKYPWLGMKKAISEEDISDLLKSNDKDINMNSKLTSFYYDLTETSQRELHQLCVNLRDRSAAILAALTFSIMKRVANQNSFKRKLVIGLDGPVMLRMHGYREEFKKYLGMLQKLNARENGVESAIWADCFPIQRIAGIYGAVALSKYISKIVR